MRVVISGYYGFGNLGDEGVLAAMLAALRPRLPHASFIVLSGDPEATARLHGVTAVPRLGMPALRALSGADVFLSGGGSLIQDASSLRSPLYYLSTLRAGTALARRTMMYAHGVGPIRRPWIRWLTGWACRRLDLLTVRDEDSRSLLRSCGVRRPIDVVADPVFALPAAPPERAAALLGPATRPRIGVALRPWGGNEYVDALLRGLRTFRDRIDAEVVVLVFHPRVDRDLGARVAAEFSARIISGVTPQEMLGVVGQLELVVGARLHALICAVAAGTPAVAVAYDPKVEALARRIGAQTVLPVTLLAPGAVIDALDGAWTAQEPTRRALRAHAAQMRADALRAADMAASLAGFRFQPTE
ncbi:MAG TPA: polysaccharide pyruvyl transferase CsaB [bacterium]|jgi:polysaccharide pyruvyl transferase CsaB